MLLTAFAKERCVSAGTVSKYISRHKADFEGHTSNKGNRMELDEEAVQLLNEIYPLQIVQVVKDEETERLLKKATEHIIELQQRIDSMSAEYIEIKSNKLAIEMKVTSLEDKIVSQEEEITRLKSRNLISRILNI